jgi:stage 0 sporulation regulatory protein
LFDQHKTILKEIQKKRELMIDLALEKGLKSDDTIKCSQELDQLIYQYQVFFRQKQQKREAKKRKMEFIFYSPKISLKWFCKFKRRTIS